MSNHSSSIAQIPIPLYIFKAKSLKKNISIPVKVVKTDFNGKEELDPFIWKRKFSFQQTTELLPEIAKDSVYVAIDKQGNVHGYISVHPQKEKEQIGIYVGKEKTARYWTSIGNFVPDATKNNSLARVGWILFAKACQIYFELGGDKNTTTNAVWTLPISPAKTIIDKINYTSICPEVLWKDNYLYVSGQKAHAIYTAVVRGKHLEI